jgi:hypothetical protein
VIKSRFSCIEPSKLIDFDDFNSFLTLFIYSGILSIAIPETSTLYFFLSGYFNNIYRIIEYSSNITILDILLYGSNTDYPYGSKV